MTINVAVGAVATAALMSGLMPTLWAQPAGSIRGRVTEAFTGRPLSGVTVEIVGARLRTHTDRLGTYVLPQVRAGEVPVRVAGHSHVTSVENVPVAAGVPTVADFALMPLATLLDTVRSIATRERRPERLPDTMALRRRADPEATVIRNPADLINGQIPGALVLRGSGQLGVGTRIQIRGATSLTLGSDPLVYVDGIRVSTAAGRSLNIWDVLDPSLIDRIEILRGPAAALHGTGASNGVILIYTKRTLPRNPEQRLP